MTKYLAFISYAHRYRKWVTILHSNLELALKQAGRSGQIFLDHVDLVSGQPWVSQLQAGLGRAEHLVLVITPEALASQRVADEWQAFISGSRDWHQGRCHLVLLVGSASPNCSLACSAWSPGSSPPCRRSWRFPKHRRRRCLTSFGSG
jgi:hypothetical protein